MALVLRHVPPDYGVLVQMVRRGTYARVDALVQALGTFPADAGIVREGVFSRSSIEARSGHVTQPGPSALTLIDEGYSVELVEGAAVSDLFELIRDALETGIILDHWLVAVDGGTLLLLDPAHHPDQSTDTGGEKDTPLRDGFLPRPSGSPHG